MREHGQELGELEQGLEHELEQGLEPGPTNGEV